MSCIAKDFYINNCDSSNLLSVQSGKINDSQGDYIIYHYSSDGRITISKFDIHKNIFKHHIIFNILASDLKSEKLSLSLINQFSIANLIFLLKNQHTAYQWTRNTK